MSSTTPTSTSPSATSSLRHKKVIVPKVWKRPHSTIYGKNVEFGTALYSDKIGELNGRKFNSELPWSVRNLATSSPGLSSTSQGYLSRPNYSSSSSSSVGGGCGGSLRCLGADFGARSNNSYDEIARCVGLNSNTISDNLTCQWDDCWPILTSDGRELEDACNELTENYGVKRHITSPTQKADINCLSYRPLVPLKLLHRRFPMPECAPKLAKCHWITSSPYGQSSDGRKLSLGSINPQTYRPSVPQKTATVHASDGEEFELYDRSSPFYTDRWAGKTIRHFDSDLYSNANLFKSMIL